IRGITISTPHSTNEVSLNGKLAEYLRQHGLDALEEQTLRSESGRLHRVDVLVNLDEYAVALEAEYAPQDGKADAAKRLTDPALEWRGVPVDAAYAIAYPANIKNLPPPLVHITNFAIQGNFGSNIFLGQIADGRPLPRGQYLNLPKFFTTSGRKATMGKTSMM
ncbi:MAG: hypothetical protein OXF23_05810, partial [Candidatus Dadabacteria bacterium]|nr:hypothetical protein [Candidatus Dadabacteria bacterium]